MYFTMPDSKMAVGRTVNQQGVELFRRAVGAERFTRLAERLSSLEYRVGKVVATAVWSEISNVIVKGNVLVGRSLLVEGKVSVVNGSNRAVKRPSIQISDVFSEEIEQVRELLLAFLQDNNETVSQSLNISRNNRM